LDQDWNQTSNDSPPPLPLQRRPSRRNLQSRVSFSFLRSVRSVHIESPQEQEPQPEQQRAASESTTTHNMTRRRPRRRQSISDENESDDCSLADSDTINIYSLFGGDPQKSCSSTDGGEKICAQDYTIAVAPLFVFLACIFIILIVVRILVALLTMAMGSMAVVLGFLRHPMWNTRKLLAATYYASVFWVAFWALVVSCMSMDDGMKLPSFGDYWKDWSMGLNWVRYGWSSLEMRRTI
jgi:hypothetical protein